MSLRIRSITGENRLPLVSRSLTKQREIAQELPDGCLRSGWDGAIRAKDSLRIRRERWFLVDDSVQALAVMTNPFAVEECFPVRRIALHRGMFAGPLGPLPLKAVSMSIIRINPGTMILVGIVSPLING